MSTLPGAVQKPITDYFAPSGSEMGIAFNPELSSTPKVELSRVMKQPIATPSVFQTPTACLPIGKARFPGQVRKPTLKPENDPKQLVLDAGQSKIGVINCEECGMIYSCEVQKDVRAHDEFHNRFSGCKNFMVEKRSFNSWHSKHKREIVVNNCPGTYFRIRRKEKSSLVTKLDLLVKDIIDTQLGICSDVPVWCDDKNDQMYLVFVTDPSPPTFPKHMIAAVVSGERVCNVKVLPVGKVFVDQAFVAVERLWVHPKFRLRGIATRLLDTLRRYYSTSAGALTRSRVAFSEPTPSGVEFARKYLDAKGYHMVTCSEDEAKTAPKMPPPLSSGVTYELKSPLTLVVKFKNAPKSVQETEIVPRPAEINPTDQIVSEPVSKPVKVNSQLKDKNLEIEADSEDENDAGNVEKEKERAKTPPPPRRALKRKRVYSPTA